MARIFPEVPGKLGTKKRVSFGSTHGSMVETLIIDDMPNEERSFYQDTLLQHNNKHTSLTSKREDKDMNSPPKIRVTFANNNNVDDLDPCSPTTTTTTTTNTSTKTETDSGVVLHEITETTFVTSESNDASFFDGDGGGGGGGDGDGGGGDGDSRNTSMHTTTSTTVSTAILPTTPTATSQAGMDPATTPNDVNVITDAAAQSSPTPRGVTPSSVTFSESVMTSGAPSPSSPTSSVTSSTTPGAGKKPGPPIIRLNRTPSTDSHENPFTADGELSKKAEYILRHSTISRSEIRISDPDLSKSSLDKTDGVTEESPLVRQETVPVQSARPADGPSPRENGKVEAPLTPQSVQVEVGTANASQPQPQQAEQVKLKDPKCKCCVIM